MMAVEGQSLGRCQSFKHISSYVSVWLAQLIYFLLSKVLKLMKYSLKIQFIRTPGGNKNLSRVRNTKMAAQVNT